MLDAFAVVARSTRWRPRCTARFGDMVDRFSFYAPYKVDPETWQAVLAGFHGHAEPSRALAGSIERAQTTTLTRRGGRATTRCGARPASASVTLAEASADGLGVGLGDAGVDLDAVADLPVDLDHHGHLSLAGPARGRRWASAGRCTDGSAGGAAPTARP